MFEGLPAGEFQTQGSPLRVDARPIPGEWAVSVAARRKYDARFEDIGPAHQVYGAPTQMGVFTQ